MIFFQAKNYINKKIHSESSKEAPHVIVSNSVVSSEPKPGLRNGSVGGLGVGRAPPSVPPRNGSKLETPSELEVIGGQRQKYFDTNIEPQPSEKNNFIKTDIVKPAPVGERTVNKNDTVVNKSDTQKAVTGRQEASETNTDATDNKNNYRDSWKSRNDTQNTFTFNFVNSKKDVSHIENDGLDLTNRNKKVRMFLKPLNRTVLMNRQRTYAMNTLLKLSTFKTYFSKVHDSETDAS